VRLYEETPLYTSNGSQPGQAFNLLMLGGGDVRHVKNRKDVFHQAFALRNAAPSMLISTAPQK
jgi:hypothetical protein